MFNFKRHVKLSIALEIIIDNGFGARRGLSNTELLILDAENTVVKIIEIRGGDNSDGFYIERAHIENME